MSKLRPLKFFKSLLGGFLVLTLLFISFIHFVSSQATAEEPSSRRAYAIKAGFIYQFTRFIKWPPQSDVYKNNNTYNICVIGDNPFGSILRRLEKKHRSKKYPLKIKLDVYQSDFEGCEILFVSFSERFDVEQIVEQTKDLPVLTVGDTAGFAERGINISLLVVKNRVKLEINKQCLDAKEFEVSSELLDLATLVQGGDCQ